MTHYTVTQWLLIFFTYCFFGWCFESTVVSVGQRKLVNRGFCTGPVIPIYGFGAVSILFATLPVRNSAVLIFFLGMAAATALEYVVGLIGEAIFKVRYWDYSERPFNVKGYICLRSSLCWGALSVFLVKFLHAWVETWILRIPSEWAAGLAVGLTAVFAYDVAASVRTALDLRDMLVQLEAYSRKAKEEAKGLQKRLETAAAARWEDLEQKREDYKKRSEAESLMRKMEAMERVTAAMEQNEKIQQLRQDLREWRIRNQASREALRQRFTGDKRGLLKRNPSTSSRRYAEQLQRLRQRIREEEEVRKARK